MNYQEMMEQALADEFEDQIKQYEHGYQGPDKVYTHEIAQQMKDVFDNEPERLILDPYFLNMDGFIYPAVIDDILELFYERQQRQINLAVFLEGIGSGKSVKSSVILWLLWFELCTFIDPQSHFGLIPGSTIAFMNMSRTEVQARRVTFNEVWHRFESPFNKDYFPPAPRFSKEIRIEANNTAIFAGTSSAASALGYNCYGGCLDLETTEIWVKNEYNTEYSLVLLKDLINRENVTILTFNTSTIKIEETTANKFVESYGGEEQQIYELELENGTIIRATENHKFLTRTKKEAPLIWKTIEEIQEGDDLVSGLWDGIEEAN